MSEKIKFAVLGLGFVGKRHLAMIRQQQEAEAVALCDIRPKSALNLPDWAEELPFYSSLSELLDQEKSVRVLCICTPNGCHAEQGLLGLEAGKEVVIEKPMALNKVDCEALIYKSLQMSKQIFVVMQNRYSPPAKWLKQLLLEQRLGAIQLVQINCYWNRDERYYRPGGQPHPWKGQAAADGGTLFTQFSHFVDMMYWLFGDIKNISARFADFQHQEMTDFEDSGLVQFDFVNGGMGCINYSTAVYQQNMESSLTVIGAKGSLKIGGQYMNEVEYCKIEDYAMPELPPANPPNDYGHYKGSAANHSYVIENVVDVLKGRKNISTNALEGLKVVEIIEKIYALK